MPPPNDRRFAAEALSVAQGYDLVSGTTLEATTTPDEPYYDSYYDPSSPDSDGTYSVHTVWYVLRGIPAGGFYYKIEAPTYVEMYLFAGEPDVVTGDDDNIGYAYAYDGTGYGTSAEHPGGTLSIMVLAYGSAGSDSEQPGPFVFGWGSGILDTDESHYGPWVGGDWVEFGNDDDVYFPPDQTVRKRGFGDPPPPQTGFGYGVRSQWAVNYGQSAPVMIGPVVPVESSMEDCAWNNARYGGVNDVNDASGTCAPIGPAPGTRDSGSLGSADYTGYQATNTSGGWYHTGNSSRTRFEQASRVTDLRGPLRAERQVRPVSPEAWGLAFPDGAADRNVTGGGVNALRNLSLTFYAQNHDAGQPSRGAWDVIVRYLSDDDRIPRGWDNGEASAESNKWDALFGGWWASPEKLSDNVMGTFPVPADKGRATIVVPDPMPMLVAPSDYESANATASLDVTQAPVTARTHLWSQTASSHQLLNTAAITAPNTTLTDRRVLYVDGTVGTDGGGSVRMGLTSVEYQRLRRRDYLGFPFLKVRQAPPMRQRARQDGLAAGTGARRGGSEPEMRQRSVRRGPGVVW